MKIEELHDELARNEIRTAYLLNGDEALLRDDALLAIREAVLVDASPDFNLDVLDAPSTQAVALRAALDTLPVAAERRLVVLRDWDERRAEARGLAELLAERVPELDGKCVLVVTAARADGRARWVRAFSKAATVVECVAPRRRREIAAFVNAEADRQGLKLGPGVAEELIGHVGPQLLMLRQELAKAALLAGPDQKLTRDHVARAACDVAEEPIWDLTDAIGQGRLGDALLVLNKLLAAGAPPPMLLGSLAGHFRKLTRLRSGGEVAGPPFVLRKLEAQAERYSPIRLLRCMEAVHQTDQALKGRGALAPGLALERLVMGLSA